MGQEKEREPTAKLLVDNITDFRFHAAYLAYSEAWDGNHSDDVRIKLNGLISSLSSTDPNYEEFYFNLSQFRKQRPESYSRTRIQGQRKGDYRRSEQKKERNSRYK
ncbi:MAG: hypothetical protein V1850_02440 [Candidatus Bathyarchaeota archaeon]